MRLNSSTSDQASDHRVPRSLCRMSVWPRRLALKTASDGSAIYATAGPRRTSRIGAAEERFSLPVLVFREQGICSSCWTPSMVRSPASCSVSGRRVLHILACEVVKGKFVFPSSSVVTPGVLACG